jgi:uncharacterized protein YcfL
MKNYLLLLPLFFIGCASVKQVPVQTIERDSLVVKEIIRDTVIVTELVPQFVDRVVEIPVIPQDTLSEISTSYAVSTAGITNNQLHHTIRNKENIPIKIEYKDKIITKTEYKEVEVPVEVVVEKKYIPNWCWWSLIVNVIMALLTGFKIYMKFL